MLHTAEVAASTYMGKGMYNPVSMHAVTKSCRSRLGEYKINLNCLKGSTEEEVWTVCMCKAMTIFKCSLLQGLTWMMASWIVTPKPVIAEANSNKKPF